MFCSCSPTSQKETPAPTPPPRPPVPSEAQRIAAALAGVPYSDAASTPVAVKSSVVDVACLGGESTPAAAPREARHTPAAPAPRTPHLDDPLSFEEYGDHTDDRRGDSVL